MKILQLEVEGFRSLKHVVWKPGDLNVVIGPNASGKSNLLKVLELLKAAAEGRLRDHVIREGGMAALAYDQEAQEIKIRCEASPIDFGPLDYRFALARLGSSSAYELKREKLVGFPYGFHPKGRRKTEGSGRSGQLLPTVRNRRSREETVLAGCSTLNGCDRAAHEYQENVASWGIYQVLDTEKLSSVRSPAVVLHDELLKPDGGNLVPVLHTLYTENKVFKEEIDSAMFAGFGDEYKELLFPPSASQRIELAVQWNSLKHETRAQDLSDGTLRYLYLLAILVHPSPPPLIAIDEPETGLHPSMMAVVAEAAAHASRKTQVILTTHSSDFLDGFYKQTTPTVTVTENRDGETHLRVPEGGELEYWLKRYTLGDLFRTTELEQME